MTTIVYLVEHTHEYGTSTYVCATAERADQCITDLVTAEWEGEMGTDVPTIVTDEHVGQYMEKTKEDFDVTPVDVLT